MRDSAFAQRSTAAKTMHGPSSATRRKAPSASAMDPEHISGSDQRVSVRSTFQIDMGSRGHGIAMHACGTCAGVSRM